MENKMCNESCCFFGHRDINVTPELRCELYNTIRNLVVKRGIHIFLFGSKSKFDSLCLETVTKIKEKYHCVQRIYVRAEFAQINNEYKKYLLQIYDDTYYPERIKKSGKAIYVERNCEMIDKSSICVCYYNKDYVPIGRKKQSKSGTKLAYEYAVKKHRQIINVFK